MNTTQRNGGAVNTSSSIVAEICLYGTRAAGASWLANPLGGPILGDPTLIPGLSFTEAVWFAVDALARRANLTSGTCRVYAPGGERVATIDLGHRVPCFGDLKWEAAGPALVISIG